MIRVLVLLPGDMQMRQCGVKTRFSKLQHHTRGSDVEIILKYVVMYPSELFFHVIAEDVEAADLIVYTSNGLAPLASKTAKFYQCPVVYAHDDPAIAGQSVISCVLGADAVLYPSKFLAERFWMYNKMSYIIGNGVDQEDFPYSGCSRFGRGWQFCYVGRMNDDRKNYRAMLDIGFLPHTRFVYYGEGSHSHHYPDGHMEYTFGHSQMAKAVLMSTSDAVVAPYIDEPFGIVCLEALAAGSILLASGSGGMREFLDEDCFIECGTTSESIKRAVDKRKTMRKDEVELMQTAGRRVCLKNSWKRIAEEFSDMVKEILEV